MEHNKLISLRIKENLLNEILEIEAETNLDLSVRIRKILEYGIKKMKDEKVSFKNQEPIFIG